MPPSVPTARDILDASRTPQQFDETTSLSTQQYEKLMEYVMQHLNTSSLESLVRDPADSNLTSEERRMKKELRHAIEAVNAEYDELFHYNDPQETDIDRVFQAVAAEFKARGGGPTPIDICRDESQSLVQHIADLHKVLERMVVRHEVLIRSRWRKKTRAQKTEVLLAAEPDIPKTHRPDIASFMSGRNPALVADTLVAHSCPHINIEDLLLPNTLPIFINARARHLPAKFAYSDLEMAPLAKLRSEFLALRDDLFTMSFLDGHSYDQYAQLIQWSSLDEQQQSLRAGRTVHVDQGMQILLLQHQILNFLVRCTIQLVEDVFVQDPHSSLVTPPEPPALTSNTSGQTLLHIVAREAPYRLPAALDFTKLKELTSAQKFQSKEHVWALREDPSYFADAIEEQRNHRHELILGLAGEVHPYAQDFPLYTRALRHLIMDSCFMVFFWDHVAKSMARLHDLSSKYADVITVHADLPAELFNELADIRYFLEHVSVDIITMVKTYFPGSPPLRGYFFRANSDGVASHIIPRFGRHEYQNARLRHLLDLIDLFGDKGFRGYFTLHTIMDELESFMQRDAESKALISPYMASMISQLAIITECLHQLHCFQPWACKVESTIKQQRMGFSRRYDAFIRPWAYIDSAHGSFDRPEQAELCEMAIPRDGKFDYPVDERSTRVNVDKMRSAEAALDKLWDAANAHWLRMAGCTPIGLIKKIIGKRVLYRTPPWTKPTKIPKTIDSLSKGTMPVLPFSGYIHDTSKEITGSFRKSFVATKAKEKTHEAAEVSPERATTVPTESPHTAYTIDKRSFRVFRNMFRSPDSPDQLGQVIWTDFLHAMVSIGFAAEKLQGSAWHFRPSTLAAERSIQFHEPHPGNKLPVAWARRYGRRLNRAFGWTADTFKLA